MTENDKPQTSPTEAAVAQAKAAAGKAADPPEAPKESLPNLGLPESAGHKGTIAIDGDAPI